MFEIREVNFAASNCCNANCLFCPRSYVEVDPRNRFMSVSLVEKVMREITQEEFKKENPVTQCVCSENGEPFMNPNILDILRIVKAYGFPVLLFSNFSLITEEIAVALAKENLTQAIHVNIDGATPETYHAVKKLNLETVKKNILRFLKIRDDLKSSVRIFGHIISQNTYVSAIMKKYGRPPAKFEKPLYAEDRIETLIEWKNILREPMDNIGIDSVAFWAERYAGDPVKGDFRCPNLERVKHCAYINPEGNWYVCCFDMGNDLVVGNVNETPLAEMAKSQTRKELIANLEAGRFKEIGFPCTRVDACHGMDIS